MTNIQDDEGSLRTVLIALIVTALAIAALMLPTPTEEQPAEPMEIHIIETAHADEHIPVESKEVQLQVIKAEPEPAPEPEPSPFDDLADAIIDCESSGRNVEIIDTNGKWSRGIAQFQDATWEWMSREAGIEGSSTEPEKARAVLLWALENGHGMHWTCYRKIKGYQ